MPPPPFLPCSPYDCARQCARADPPFYNASAGVNDFGKTFYDIRYISCIEACPGVRNPIPADSDANTTTGIGALPTVTPEVTVVNANCSVDEGMAPCGEACCAERTVCYRWGNCAPADELDAGRTATTTVDSTNSIRLIKTRYTTSTALASSTTTAKSGAGRLGIPFFVVALVAFLQPCVCF